MNILLYEWNTFGQKDLEENLIRLGYKVDKIKYIFTDFENDEVFEKKLSDLFLLKKYDYVISFNFFQIISKVCNSFCIKYIAWVWDSPLLNLNSKTIYSPFNYIFIFDSTLYQQMKQELGADTVYYLPLAVNTERLDKLIDMDTEAGAYTAEVSFVGNLYDKRNHFDGISNLPEYLRGYFDGIMRSQMKIYGYNFVKEMLTEEIMSELAKYIDIRPGKNYIGDIRDIFADRFLNAKITGIERRTLLKALSEYYDVTLYTDSDSSELTEVHNKGYIDYYKVLPKVFHNSKINLNITVRTIKSGIPLRVFDILGSGGFLITNYQPDIENYFEIGEDLVCYESREDLIEKVGYYLQHEEERKRIAKNGYQKVKQFHTYEIRLKEIFNIVSGSKAVLSDAKQDDGSIERMGQQLNYLVLDGKVEDAKIMYYSYLRTHPGSILDNIFPELDFIFQIHTYEKFRGRNTLFDFSRELTQVCEHYDRIKKLVLGLQDEREDLDGEFYSYADNHQVSYTAIEFIISRYSFSPVELLNRVAWIFLKKGRNEMILPFLSLAIELAPGDDSTLYHLAFALYQMGEYQMAYDYINELTIASPEALELMENILKQI